MKLENLKHLDFDYEIKHEQVQFLYSNKNNEYLQVLSKKYSLEEKVTMTTNDLEKVIIITQWVNSLWKHNGTNQPIKSDALSILEEIKKGKNFRCVEFSIVNCACLNAIGIPTRTVSLKIKDVESIEYGAGHVVTESYLKDQKKWILSDPQFNVIVTDKNNIPLNLFEFQANITREENVKIISKAEVNFIPLDNNEYIKWIYPYLYYADIPFDNRYDTDKETIKNKGKLKLMLVPTGAKNPTLFQIVNKIDYCIYSNNINEFYQIPNY